MIYMVEMDFPHPERLAEWHDWYLAHIRVLLTVPGFRASQRFQAITETPSPYLALHEVASPALFESAEYRARGGPASTGEWRALQTNWHRNLLDGLDETKRCRKTGFSSCCATRAMPGSRWMRRSRGCAGSVSTARPANAASQSSATPTPLVEIARRDERVQVYRPISEKIRAAAAP